MSRSKDHEMMCVSVPTVDFWDIQEEIERLGDAVDRLETILQAFILLYQEERRKTWKLVLDEMFERMEHKKGYGYGSSSGRR